MHATAPLLLAQTTTTLTLSEGGSGIAAEAIAVTTISGASGTLNNTFLTKHSAGYWDNGASNAGLLAGLVGITAGCSTVEPEGALMIGVMAAFVYKYSSRLILILQVCLIIFTKKVDADLFIRKAYAVSGACLMKKCIAFIAEPDVQGGRGHTPISTRYLLENGAGHGTPTDFTGSSVFECLCVCVCACVRVGCGVPQHKK